MATNYSKDLKKIKAGKSTWKRSTPIEMVEMFSLRLANTPWWRWNKRANLKRNIELWKAQ